VNLARGAFLATAVAVVLLASACGNDEVAHSTTGRQPEAEAALGEASAAELPNLARALIPSAAVDPPEGDELAVEECGIYPVFPCVSTYFVTEDLTLEERLVLLRRQAEAAGWRLVSERRSPATIDLARAGYRARYVLEADALFCQSAARCLAGTMLTVAGRPTPLPQPSLDDREGWTTEKRAFVAAASTVCTEMQERMRDPGAIANALDEGLAELSALTPPAGEEREVDLILRPLRHLARAAAALTDDKGEDALPAAVAVGEFARRFNEVAIRYGLAACAQLG
jgi:hypothetical protein